ncbi:DUF7665 family protein [Mycolicibacterium phocaicum]|nr:hypothetical protein MPHO_51590 [Mycolicibacterium phocaicum]
MVCPGADPAKTRLERDLARGDVECGVEAGMWRVVSLRWPELIVAITAGDGNEVAMRLLVDDYPVQAPAGEPWSIADGGPLPQARWPTSPLDVATFRKDWSPSNGNAPYVACDRTCLRTHPDWATAHPDRAWNPGRTIAFYLQEMHRELQCASVPQLDTVQ